MASKSRQDLEVNKIYNIYFPMLNPLRDKTPTAK